MKPKILVSHSGKQYVHQLLQALHIHNFEFNFLTSFSFRSDSFPYKILNYFPERVSSKIKKELRKRSFSPIPDNRIFHFPYFEFIREVSDKIFKNAISERMLFIRDRIHDRWASTKVTSEYQIVVGYEECCLKTFRRAKALGITTILDLAQIHFKEIESISNEFPVFSEIYKNRKLREKINEVKREEIQLADYIFCLSSFAKESLIKNGVAEGKIFVVNLGFDPEKFFPKKNYDAHEKLNVVFTGTITKRKGIDLLLRLKSELDEKIELTLVGPMADAADLFKNYKSKVNWYSYLEHSELNNILNSNDVFVFPSYLDSWAMVVIEAMACGLPVIVTENTGAKDAVDEKSGFVIPPGDYQHLKKNVLFLFNNREMLRGMGKKARAVSEDYTWSSYYGSINHCINLISQELNVNISTTHL